MTKGAIVFDLDGTLIDSAPDINAIANTVLAGAGAANITLEQTHSFIGNGSGEFVTKMMREQGLGNAPELHHKLHGEFEELYKTATDLSVLYPGVTDTLDALKDAGFTAKDIEEVIMVGGMTRMPLVQGKVKEFFNKEPNKTTFGKRCDFLWLS